MFPAVSPPPTPHPLYFFIGASVEEKEEGAAFNQHDEPCHTHTDREGRRAGRRAIISPSLHNQLLTRVAGASADLQEVQPH